MISVVMDMEKEEEEEERCLDSRLWYVCAGEMVQNQMPKVNSKVFYFPQGHAEHANGKPEFSSSVRIPPYILCRVSYMKLLADTETDEVYAKLGLVPLKNTDYGCYGYDDNDHDCGGGGGGFLGFHNNTNSKNDCKKKPNYFAKTLTQSDANNGGGFSVPRHCADNIYPRLNYEIEPPVQNIFIKDVHGKEWKFRHIYRGTPRRHLLTTGWSNFVNQKKLVAGDTIVFLKEENGDICVGIRRANRRGFGGGPESGWNGAVNYGGGSSSSPSSSSSSSSVFAGLSSIGIGEEESGRLKRSRNGQNRVSSSSSSSRVAEGGNGGKLNTEFVTEAANLAATGKPFEVIFYPRASPPPFVVKASAVTSAMRINWCPGMRFKMAIETEDSSRVSWFMGIVSSVQVDDPINWPNSPWRLLQVTWDESNLHTDVKHVNPWMVELVSSMPSMNLTPFSVPQRKKLRIPQPPGFSFPGQQLPMASFLTNIPLSPSSNLSCLSDNNHSSSRSSSGGGITAGVIQGARHLPQLGLLPSPEIPFYQQRGLLSFKLNMYDPSAIQFDNVSGNSSQNKENENDSRELKGENNSSRTLINPPPAQTKPSVLVLFGKRIVIEQQTSETTSSSSSDENPEKHTAAAAAATPQPPPAAAYLSAIAAGVSGSLGIQNGTTVHPTTDYYYYPYCCPGGVFPWYRDQNIVSGLESNAGDGGNFKSFIKSEDM